jgi:hypothetical protein
MDIETLTDDLKLTRRLVGDIDVMVKRRREALDFLEQEGSDTSKARQLLNVAEELQRKISSDKKHLEKELQDLSKREDRR